MPKKFGTNTKSAEARSRKEAVKLADQQKKQKEAEDALWQDDDKHVQRKQQRKDDRERKKQEQLDKKIAREQAYEEEMSNLKSAKIVSTKITRADIAKIVEGEQVSTEKTRKSSIVTEQPLEENINRIVMEEEVARDVDEAISILSVTDKVDQHPERRMKAAYHAYEAANLQRLTKENPNLRLSQVKQMLKKDWMKSPDNPMNQKHAVYNAKK